MHTCKGTGFMITHPCPNINRDIVKLVVHIYIPTYILPRKKGTDICMKYTKHMMMHTDSLNIDLSSQRQRFVFLQHIPTLRCRDICALEGLLFWVSGGVRLWPFHPDTFFHSGVGPALACVLRGWGGAGRGYGGPDDGETIYKTAGTNVNKMIQGTGVLILSCVP